MKHIVNISLGPKSEDYQLEVKFLDTDFAIKRFGTDGNLKKAEDLLLHWNKKADVICIFGIQFPHVIGTKEITDLPTKKLLKLSEDVETPVVTGEMLRKVTHEWSLRHLQFAMNSCFTNARVFFFSGRANFSIANVINEFTDNLFFADAVLENGIPKILNSIPELKMYAGVIHNSLQWIPGKNFIKNKVKIINDYLIRKTVENANVIVIPYYNFFEYISIFSEGELDGKIVISTTIYKDRVDKLKELGVDIIIDTTPKILEHVVGVGVLEALMVAGSGIAKSARMNDELLEIISEQRINPRVIFTSGKKKCINRFAYIVHPLSVEYLKKLKPIETLSEISPVAMGFVEKAMAYSPPFVYSKVTGIKSPTGSEAEGWFIALGETPEQMQIHGAEFTTKRILQAAEKAKSLGAQVMGVGMLPRVLEKTSADIEKYAALPVTSGNSYIASTVLWASAEAVRRMGLIKTKDGKILRARAMVLGATGGVGAICSQLLATAFEEVYLISRNMAKLLTIKEAIEKEQTNVNVHVSTQSDKYLGKMDVIVSSRFDHVKHLDIMRVKPGCVITDIAIPKSFTPEIIAKRRDVLVITGGEILLPGTNIEMKDIYLPPGVVYAAMAETIILALEGRLESFTKGRETEWEKVKEIYKLGIKHGMKLSAISGVNGVLTDDDIARVKEFALKNLSSL